MQARKESSWRRLLASVFPSQAGPMGRGSARPGVRQYAGRAA